MSRIYGNIEEVDSEKIKKFFNNRAKKDEEALLVKTEFSDKENVEKRHKEESELLLNKIDFENKKILEIGCGTGRWAEVFHKKCDSYLGFDYSEDLIEIAKENYNYDNCHFQVLSASQLDTADLLVSAPFDIVIITGVLIYFNDDTIKKMIKDLNSLCASNKTIYIRETLSFLETRLTLKDFFSENLEADYNAIYRTDDEFLDFIKGIDGNITIETGEIFDELKKENDFELLGPAFPYLYKENDKIRIKILIKSKKHDLIIEKLNAINKIFANEAKERNCSIQFDIDIYQLL